ncbi:MAG TPA: C39 family peptidase [Candidatus Dormibacteraeota bacterium]|nr:C39 family peptidase [Candidatus Dormibacteraeota bacterium]
MTRVILASAIGAAALLYFVVWAWRRSRVRRQRRRAPGVQWASILTAVVCGSLIGGSAGVAGRYFLPYDSPQPLPGVTNVAAQPLDPEPSPGPAPSPKPLPARLVLQVPYTTQAPLGNWAAHQESCEAATLTMVLAYWNHDPEIVISPRAADASINRIDAMKTQLDLTNTLLGQLARDHFGLGYEIIPNTPANIRAQIAAGRPIIAEVRTHGLGNGNYPGYFSHYEEKGWSVPHFIVIIGYDSTGVFLNDAGISKGRGYHISFAQLTHAIDDLDVHHPNLNEGQVLLVVAPVAPTRIPPGIF